MGMFDSFYIEHRGQFKELQNKEFECSLVHFYLGDRIENAPGLRLVTIDFDSIIRTTNLKKDNKYDGNLVIGIILLDGVWVDYFIAPTFATAEALGEALLERYKTPYDQIFALKMSKLFSEYKINAHQGQRESFFEYLHDFKERRIAKKNKPFFSIKYTKIPKKELTFKNLLNFLDGVFQHKKDIYSSPSMKIYEYLRATPSYHYDGPKRNVVLSSETQILALTEQEILHAFKTFDFELVRRLQLTDNHWFSRTTTEFKTEIFKFLDGLRYSFLGLQAWLYFCELNKDFNREQPSISYSTHEIHFSNYLLEMMGVDEAWIMKALEVNPNLLKGCEQLSFLSAFSYPQIYEKFNLSLNDLATTVTPDGRTHLYSLIDHVLHYDTKHEAIRMAWALVDAGTDLLHTDEHGNTPFMHLLLEVKDNPRLWEQTQTNEKDLISLCHHMAENHPLSYTNKKGESIRDLLPDHDKARLMLSNIEKKHLSKNHSTTKKFKAL